MTSGASTKLCATVSICQCKQMSFQLPFESTFISKFLESKKKIIPCFWSGIRELHWLPVDKGDSSRRVPLELARVRSAILLQNLFDFYIFVSVLSEWSFSVP